MKIKYLGHSCFQIFSETQSVVIDPYSDGSVPGLEPLRVKANAVYCSHQHADHNGVSCVEFDGEDTDFARTQIASWHDDQQGALRGPNTIQVFECDDKRIAHLGDLGCDLDDEQRAQLQDLDVLMIPVGGYFTIDAKQAAKIVLELKPKCVIPMHYKGENFGYDVLATVDDFLALVPGARKIDADEIELTDAKGLIVLKFN
jgi:L-ascorbate metabolism protein UlaG (beta-lactamase superfamily)